MKNIYCLLFLLFACSPAGTAQDDECLPNEQRQLINDMVATNRVKYGIRKENGKKLLPSAYIWPVAPSPTTNAASVSSICQFVDHDPSGGLLDWNCGDRTYNGHRGTDICCTPYPWYMVEQEEAHVVAMAGGTILWKMDGNDSYSCDFSRPDWNGVGIQHSDGSTAWYGHLKENSLTTKSVGQSVTSGEFLGVMASSGMSTGPHLHIEIYDTDGNLVDPYAGSCNALNPSTSYWQDQPEYHHPGINRVMVQSAPTDYGPDCNSVEDPNYLEQANAGDVIHYRIVFSGISAGTSATYRLTAPDGSTLLSQTNNYNSNGFGTFFGNSFTLPNDLVTGNYRFEATYLGVTVDYEFEVMGNNCTHPDFDALMAFYNATGGAGWSNKNGWEQAAAGDMNACNPCNFNGEEWFGVGCSSGGRVTRLSLNGNNLAGTIPAEINGLTELLRLYVRDNSLTGNLPTSIGQLSNIIQILAGGNNLDTPIPSQIGNLSTLEWLDLAGNNIVGTIPTTVGGMTSLETLQLGENNLSGNIPDQLGQLSNLFSLELSDNNLSGAIPGSLGNITNLDDLILHTNNLTGNIPPELGNFVDIDVFDLRENNLSGEIPEELGNLTSVRMFRLQDNNLTGEIPPSLAGLSGVSQFRLENNNLSGCIPSGFSARCGNNVNMSGNPLLPHQGDFTVWCVDNISIGAPCDDGNPITENDAIDADCNCVGGIAATCDDGIQNGDEEGIDCGGSNCVPCTCAHPDYAALMALYNSTNGSEWSNRSGWEEGANNESCDPCNYNGSPWYGVTCRNGRIRTLFLGSNNLSGVLPTELGMLSTAETIDLARNDIGGTLPTSVGNLSSIERLFLGENSFEGLIPTSIGQLNTAVVIGLNANSFSGSIPVSISQLTSLEQLSLSRNQLTGGIPPELGQMPSIEQLNLSLNLLGGEIPEELGQATQLFQLGLASNQLTGCLPNFVLEACTNTLNIDLTNNPELPYSGSFTNFCQNLISVGAPCNDSNPATTNDAIDADCNCTGQLPATCDDGIQNGDEEGVDCGGSNCPDCTIPCNETTFLPGVGSSSSAICLGEEVTINFTLTATGNPPFTADVSGNGLPVGSITHPGDGSRVSFTITPTQSSTYRISNVRDAQGCGTGISPGWGVSVRQPAPVPVLNCVSNTSESVTINYSEDPAVAEYRVSVNNGPLQTMTGGTFTATGLPDNQNVTLVVTAIPENGCDPSTEEIVCNTLPATCNDGIQNGDEEGVDCGGSNCAPCTIPCNETNFSYQVSMSAEEICLGEEVTATFTLNATGNPPYSALVSGNGLPINIINDMPGDGTPVSFTFTPTATSDYTIGNVQDAEGCGSNPAWVESVFVGEQVSPPTISCTGSTLSSASIAFTEDPSADGYTVSVNGGVPETVTGGAFTATGLPNDTDVSFTVTALGEFGCSDQSTTITCRTLPATCNDGIQNGDEEGVDCGGTDCVPCFIPCNETGYTYSIEASETVICRGTEINLSLFLNAANGNPPYQLLVTGPDGIQTPYEHPGDGTAVTFTSIPSESGSYRIEGLTDGAACTYTNPSAVAVTVEEPIPEPTLTCITTTQNSITIGWDVNAAVDRYELYVNGDGPQVVDDETFTINNLPPDEAVNFELFLVSASVCVAPVALLSCRTMPDPCEEDFPTVNLPSITGLCASGGIVDLTVLEEDILLGQEAFVEWFTDAAGGQVIADERNFAPATAPFTVYVRVTNTGCSSEITPITLDQVAPQVPSFAALPSMLCYDDPIYPLPQPTDGTIGTWTLSGEGGITAINPALYGSTTLLLVFEPDSSAGDCLTLFEHEIIVTEPSALNFSLSADTVCTDFGLVATLLGEDAGATEIGWSGVPEPDSIITEGNTATFYFAEAGNAVITGQRMINDCAGEPVSRMALVESCEDCVRLIDCIPQFGQSASLVMIDTFVNVGESVCIPILVANLSGFVDLGFSLQWDPEVFSFVEVNNVVPELGAIPIVATSYQPDEVAINVASAASGTLSFYWRSFALEDDCTLAPVLTFQEPIPLFEICLQATQAPLEPETNLAFVNQPQAVTGNKPSQCQNEGDALVVGFGASAILNGNCEHPDYAALMAFYESTNGPEWNTKTGWEAGALGESCDPCNYNGGTWFGVICGQQGQVTNLNLPANNLTGQIPAAVGELESLLRLDLRQNSLQGEIPQELGRLFTLWGLFLQNNQLEGNISDSLENISGLRFLNLSSNQLGGPIPGWLGSLNSLSSLNLSVNQLNGEIPSEIGNLSSLVSLNLGFNNLSGSIPAELGTLTALETLLLSANNLSLSIPASLGNLDSLTWIDLSGNDLSGCFPDELQIFCDLGPFDQATFTGYNFSGNPQLPFFGIYESVCAGEEQVGAICNDLAGTETEVILEDCSCREEVVSCDHPDFPALMALYENTNGSTWTNQTGWAEAANGEACDPCNFNGVPWYGITCDQGRVICVDLDGDPDCSPNGGAGNGLTGAIPQAFFELDSVQCLSFAGQGITGELPPDYTGVPSVRCFSFINTDLQGEVPLGVSAMTNVRRFILEDGDFSGPFPEGLRDMNDIQDISITFSDISGPLPTWLGGLTRLRQLFLPGNNLQGQIPGELEQLDSLVTLFAQDNDLEGPIPEGLAQVSTLREIALSRNRLSGDIPLALFDLPDLEFLYLYSNELTGDVGEITSRVNGLQALYLDDNNLTGCYELNDELCQLSEVTTFGGQSSVDGGLYRFYNENGYNFRNNPALPLEGSYAAFCDGEEQVGSICDDGDPSTQNDSITNDCGCAGQLIITQPIILNISDEDAAPGEEIEIIFTADTLDDVVGLLLAFTYETELLELLSISGNIAGIDLVSNTSVEGEVISLWAPFGVNVSASGRDVELLSATFLVLDTCSTQIAIDTSIRPIEFNLGNESFPEIDFSDTGNVNSGVNCCSDGIQNGSETGVDCGGANCAPCECLDTDLVIFNGNITPAFCSAANGSAAVITTGGVSPYVYEWSNGATTAVNNNLLPGDYFVTVTDSLGCSVTNLGNPVRILDNAPIVPVCPDDLFFTVDANADSLLFDVVSPVIGDCTDEGLSYQVTGTTDLSGQGIPEALVLNLGTSILTFTTGLDSCSYSVTVEQSTVDCSDLLIISLEAQTALCYGDSSGLINVELAGGSGNYQAQWSSGKTEEDLQNLIPGVYVLTLSDLTTECTVTAGFWLQSPDSIQMQCLVNSSEDPNAATVSFTGATLPVTLTLSGRANETVNIASAADYQFTGLEPGLYDVLLTDNNGCEESCQFEITESATNNYVSLGTIAIDTIVFQFDQGIDLQGINTNQIFVSGKSSGHKSGEFTVAENLLTFVPEVEFYAGEMLQVTVGAGAITSLENSTAVFFETIPTQEGKGTFDEMFTGIVLAEDQTERSYQITAVDLNQDGLKDALCRSHEFFGAPTRVATYLRQPDGTFDEPQFYESPYSHSSLRETSDLNNDGYPDLLITCNVPSSVRVRLNNGDGTFGEESRYNVESFSNGADAADFNGDGFLDIISFAGIANAEANTFSLLLNNGDGTFGEQIVTETDGFARTFSYVDIDNDLDIDVLFTSGSSSFAGPRTARVYVNDGNASFTLASSVENMELPYFTKRQMDINGDGYKDFSFGAENGVMYKLGDGTATFDFTSSVAFTEERAGFYPNYFNRDGRVDFMTSIDGTLNILLQEEDNTFTTSTYAHAVDRIMVPDFIDFNEDAAVDFMYVRNDSVFVALNEPFECGELLVTEITASICANDSIMFNDTARYVAGVYRLTTLSSTGCDSTSTLTLEVLPIVEETTTDVICSGSEFFWHDMILTEPGFYQDTLTSVAGCDSIIQLELIMEDPPEISFANDLDLLICPTESSEIQLTLGDNQTLAWRTEPDGILIGTQPVLTVSSPGIYSFAIFDTISGCTIDSFITVQPDLREPIVNCPEDTAVLLNMGQFSSVTVSSGVPELIFAPCDDIAFPPAEDLELTETDTYTWEYQSNNGQGGSCERTINVIATDTMTIYVDEPNIYRRGTDTLMIPIAIRNWSNVESFIFDLEATVQTAGGTLVPIALAPNPAFVDGIDIELLSPTRISVTWTSAPGEMDVPSDFRLLELPLVVTGNPGDCVNLHFGTSFDNAATAMMEGQQIYLSTVDGLACLPLVASMSGNVFRLRPDLTVAPLANVTLELQQREEGSLSSLSLEDGRYRFEELPVNESYEIVPSLDDDFRRGIDLLDVVLLRDIWLNYDNPVSISTPYQLIAADVFPDCQINFIDLTFEVQMMLGGIDSFPGNTPWRFIPSAFEFPEEYALCDPPFPESITYSPLLEDQPAGDFIGVKTGDLSLNASSPLLEGSTEIEMNDQLFREGDTVRVSTILGAGEIAAAVYYRYDLSALSYLPRYNQVNGQSFRLNYSNKAGEIDQVLIDAAGEDELVFIAMKDGRLSRALFLREGSQVASLDHRFNALKLRWKDVALAAKGIKFSVYPNPFSDRLFIRFESFLNAAAQLTVRDLTGRTLYQTRLPAGVNRYVLETVTQKWPAGVYIVTVENGFHAQQKMIVKK